MEDSEKKQLYRRLGWGFFFAGHASLTATVILLFFAHLFPEWPIPWILRPLKLFIVSAIFFALGTDHMGISVPGPLQLQIFTPLRHSYEATMRWLGLSGGISARAYGFMALLLVVCLFDV